MITAKRLTLAVVLAALALPAKAHDFWLAAGSGRVEILHGHPGEIALPDKARLFDLSAVGAQGKGVSLLDQVAVADGMLTAPLPKAASVVVARYDNGFWIRNAQGYRNTSLRNLPDAQKSLWSQKSAKLLLPGEGVTRAVGHRLELVPLADPFRLKPGQSLKLRLVYAGKPLAGAEVEIGDGKTKVEPPRTLTTDADGVVEVVLVPGQTVLVASHTVPGSFPDLAAEDFLAAALTFNLGS